METNEKITDELIAKYINGNTTEEEDALIHDYLAQNPEFANDLLDIATALRHQHKHDEEIRNGLKEQPKEAKRIFLSRRFIYPAAAASLVLLIGVGFYFKTSTKNGFLQEQPSVAEVNTEISNTPTNPNGSIEATVLETPEIIKFDSEEVLIADNHEPDVQPVVNISESQVDQSLFADNTNPHQQQENEALSSDPDGPMVASMTICEDNGDAPLIKDAVFNIADIPTNCNPDTPLLLNWSCNAPKLVLEIRYGNGKIWKKTFDNTINQISLGRNQLSVFKSYDRQGLKWKMTAFYRDGTLTKDGFIRFTNDSN